MWQPAFPREGDPRHWVRAAVISMTWPHDGSHTPSFMQYARSALPSMWGNYTKVCLPGGESHGVLCWRLAATHYQVTDGTLWWFKFIFFCFRERPTEKSNKTGKYIQRGRGQQEQAICPPSVPGDLALSTHAELATHHPLILLLPSCVEQCLSLRLIKTFNHQTLWADRKSRHV